MRRGLRIACAVAAVTSATACGGGGGGAAPTSSSVPQTAPQKVAALEASGSIPRLDRGASVSGVDGNANGVRDDVDAYIASNFPTAEQRAAATQIAGVMQSAMTVDSTDANAVKAVSVRGSRAVRCVYLRFTGSNGDKQPAAVVSEIESVSANTKTRLLAYLAYAKALDGSAGSLPQGDTCE